MSYSSTKGPCKESGHQISTEDFAASTVNALDGRKTFLIFKCGQNYNLRLMVQRTLLLNVDKCGHLQYEQWSL